MPKCCVVGNTGPPVATGGDLEKLQSMNIELFTSGEHCNMFQVYCRRDNDFNLVELHFHIIQQLVRNSKLKFLVNLTHASTERKSSTSEYILLLLQTLTTYESIIHANSFKY